MTVELSYNQSFHFCVHYWLA